MLLPWQVGYDKTAEIAKQAYKEDKIPREIARGRPTSPKKILDKRLDARKMTEA